jgi:hypothetical protein
MSAPGYPRPVQIISTETGGFRTVGLKADIAADSHDTMMLRVT